MFVDGATWQCSSALVNIRERNNSGGAVRKRAEEREEGF
jgi:hypothetical protein